jgi:hypothetical protein
LFNTFLGLLLEALLLDAAALGANLPDKFDVATGDAASNRTRAGAGLQSLLASLPAGKPVAGFTAF